MIQSTIAKYFARLILGPSNWIAQWIVANVLQYAWDLVVKGWERMKDEEQVKKVKEAEEALKKAKTEKEVDDALDDIISRR